MKLSEKVLRSLVLTAEVCGSHLSDAAIEIMLHDLAEYPEDAVLAALADCRKTLTGRLSLAAIIERVKAQDGRPGAEEAWALLPFDENDSVAWTEEMRAAWGVAQPLLEAGDKVAARMAFKEAYTRRVEEARASGDPVRWEVSLGLDPAGREAALERAVRAGYIGHEHAASLLPHHGGGAVAALLDGNTTPLIAAQETELDRDTAIKNLQRLRDALSCKPVIKAMPDRSV